MENIVTFTLNGKEASVATDPDRKLLWVLRTDLALTGAKYGCGEGFCGACTVLVDDQAVRSCRTSLQDVAGKHVTTIEGLALNGELHPVQKAFAENDAMQCGYCTPGMIMSAVAFLKNHPHDGAREEIVAALDDNLCRCGAHNRIIKAVEAAAKEM
jgi:aerobic-type carbon monoxide dehydrogenase small subunit (CoxS/CutS family)